MELPLHKPGFDTSYKPGYGTEYTERYTWDEYYKSEKMNKGLRCQPMCEVAQPSDCCLTMSFDGKPPKGSGEQPRPIPPPCVPLGRDPGAFKSDIYPCVYRNMSLTKDDRGKYIDPFQDLITMSDGRQLMYDCSHPEMIFGSQWSSELADPPNLYSFPVKTGMDPEIPFTKDVQWQVESEVGKWPTDKWKEWTEAAVCPCYDGHDDQIQYSKYKIQYP